MIREFFCEIFLSCAVVTTTPLTLDELMHRSVLFDAYQSDYAGAFVKALAYEELGLVDPDDNGFALTKGSLAVQQGLHGYAASTFARVEGGVLGSGDRVRLGLEKARLHHQRGDLVALKAELGRLDELLPAAGTAALPELRYLQADLLLQQGKFRQAALLIETLPADDDHRAYALFNMAMALRDSNQSAEAYEVLKVLLAMPAAGREVRDLQERGRLAQAHVAAEIGRADDAGAILEDLPADSRYRNAAVAAYATHAMQRGDNNLAARLFQSVIAEEPWPTRSAYAQIGLPVALQGMTEPALVLGHFRVAQSRLERRVAVLETVQKQLLEPAFVARLVRATVAPGQDAPALGEVIAAWRADLPETEWIDWLAAEEVAAATAAWRDLSALAAWSAEVPARLAALHAAGDDSTEAAVISGRARALNERLARALGHEESRIAERLAARLQAEIETVRGYLLTADLAVAQATDQVAHYARPAAVEDRR